MDWFQGSIPEAIMAAKSRKAVFVVYIRDLSEASKTTDEALAQKDVVEAMNGGHFVAIKLENGTEDTKQFSQIYPLVLVPSLFFISGETGVPLEVLGGPLTVENLKDKVNKLLDNVKPTAAANANSTSPRGSEVSKAPEGGGGSSSVVQKETAEVSAAPQASCSPSPPATQDGKGEKAGQQEPLQDENTPVAEATEPSDRSDSEAGLSQSTLEEKVERAKTLLAEKQEHAAREKAETEKQKEIDRRKMGQEMAKRKLQQEQDEIRAAARERRKDKEEDRLARERVKAQIAADRAEKEARAALLRGEAPSSQASPPPASAPPPQLQPQPSSASNISRLKFRLPDGSSTISQFPAEAPLSEVRQYIDQNVDLPFSHYTLASTVQHRPFAASDNNTSLRDLGLVPSAILVILPSAPSRSGRVVPAGGGIWDMMWLLLSPITFVLGLVQRFMFGRRQHPAERSEEPQPKRPREDPTPPSTRQRPTTAYGSRSEARFRQQGNVHRLQNDGDEDDDNNTWNGNSTQQM